MDQLLHSLRMQDVAMLFFFAGVWWADKRAAKRAENDERSRRSQGQRLGEVERQVAEQRGGEDLARKIVELLSARGASRSDG